MSYTDAISRISQIQDQIASMRSAFVPTAAQPATTATTAAAASGSAATAPTSFADELSGAMSPTATTASTLSTDPALSTGTTASSFALSPGLSGITAVTPATAATGGAGLPAGASSMLTSGQQQFASRLGAETGLDPGVVSAWVLSEESGNAAASRQSAGNNDWLNIGYTDSGTFGSADSVWSDPDTAADATAGWLKGQNTIPGYGTASSGIQAILQSAGQPPADQISALQGSGWASSGYPQLASLYQQIAG